MPSAPQIRSSVAALRERPHAQVLIIGGGINGIATLRDLALQGIDAALVEREDYVSGASAASSHMVHGGIRYLENGEFRLVRESVIERNDLLRTAPHMVTPLKTTVPIHSTFSGLIGAPLRFLRHGRGRPSARGAFLIKIGLVIYDSFSRGGKLPRHEFHGRAQSFAALPELHPDVKYTATYWDASMRSPERLALDLLNDALTMRGRARASNYVAAVGVSESGVRLRDGESGEEFEFQAPVVLNASGPWADVTGEILGERTRFMGGTKGSHLVLDHPELLAATGGREIFFEHKDGRIVLIYPLGDRVLVGTSDLEHDMADPIICTKEEVSYFLELIQDVFPAIQVAPEQIVYRFAGVRPLPGHDELSPGFVSRDYRIESRAFPGGQILTLVGGKWTTFRAVAEHITDTILQILDVKRRRSTRGLPIGGGAGFPTSERARELWITGTGWSRDQADTLLRRYGTRARQFLRAGQESADVRLRAASEYSVAELSELTTREQVVHLEDLLLRRTTLAFEGRATDAVLQEACAAIAPVLGWDAVRVDEEIARCRRAIEKFRDISPDPENAAGAASSTESSAESDDSVALSR